MTNKTRLEEQSSLEPINVINNNKHIKIAYIYIYIYIYIYLNSKINELQSVVQSSPFDK